MRVYGNLMNRLAETIPPVEPQVGMGATILMYSDREPATVIKVVSPSKIRIQRDAYRRVDSNGTSESQSWEFEPDPRGEVLEVTKRKNGAWYLVRETMKSGTIVRLGERDKYYDFSF